jgi:ABC-type transport system involved in cytochrome c biogenesis permease subunit
MNWVTANIVGTCMAYAVSTGFFLLYLLRFTERWMRLGRGALVLSAVLHGIALIHLAFLPHGLPGGIDLAFLLSFALVVAYFGIGLRFPVKMAGPFLAPMVTVVLYSTWEGMRQESPVSAEVLSVITPVHIGASTLGILAFLVAFVTSALYIIQDHQLRGKLSLEEGRFRLPPQVTLDRISARAIGIGFPAYTLGIVLGAVWAFQGGLNAITAQYLFALVSWVIYAVIVHGRRTIGWSGRRAAVLTVVGFLAALTVVLIYLTRPSA